MTRNRVCWEERGFSLCFVNGRRRIKDLVLKAAGLLRICIMVDPLVAGRSVLRV